METIKIISSLKKKKETKQRKEYYTETIVVVYRDYSHKVVYVFLRPNVTI